MNPVAAGVILTRLCNLHCKYCAVPDRKAVLFDDCEKNLRTAKQFGSSTVLCNEKIADEKVVDYQTDNLSGDMAKIMAYIKQKRQM